MIKLALTGPQLAELYLMNSFGVPSGKELDEAKSIPYNKRVYLVDTDMGRDMLLEYAMDLHSKIKMRNESLCMDEMRDYLDQRDAYTDSYVSKNKSYEAILKPLAEPYGGDECIERCIVNYFKEKLREKGIEDEIPLDSSPRKDPQLLLIKDAKKLKKKIDVTIRSIGYDLIRSRRNDLSGKHQDFVRQWIDNTLAKFSDAFNDDSLDYDQMVKEFRDILLSLTKDSGYITRLYNENLYVFADIIDGYEYPSVERKLVKQYIEKNREEVIEEMKDIVRKKFNYDYQEMPVHIALDFVLHELEQAINKVTWASRTRDDFLNVMAIIDKLSSMSHHGGPAFEYADSTQMKDVDLIEVMHRKLGDRFIPWLLSKNIIQNYNLKKDLQQWYNEKVGKESSDAYSEDLEKQKPEWFESLDEKDQQSFDKNWHDINYHRGDYYKHPRYQNPDKWLSEKSPTFRDFTPYPPIFHWLKKHQEDYPDLAKYVEWHGDIKGLDDILNIASIGDAILFKDYEKMTNRDYEIEEFLYEFSDISREVVDDARRLIKDFNRERLKLSHMLDQKGMFVRADELEKEFVKLNFK